MPGALDGSVSIGKWKALQEVEAISYRLDHFKRGNYFGHFSVPEFHPTEQLAERLGRIEGPVLDVGCGILPMPNYLKLCREPMGVDPYYGEGARAFPFAQAVGEHLPFRDGHFAGVALMSSLDHVYSPGRVLEECWRVLRRGGELFVWYIGRDRPDQQHPWAFRKEDLMEALGFGFGNFTQHGYSGDRKAGYPRTELLIGTRL